MGATPRFDEDLRHWNQTDPDTADRVLRIMQEIQDNPFGPGIGKAERLKHGLRGYCSRRLTKADRVVYRITKSTIDFVSCRFHY